MFGDQNQPSGQFPQGKLSTMFAVLGGGVDWIRENKGRIAAATVLGLCALHYEAGTPFYAGAVFDSNGVNVGLSVAGYEAAFTIRKTPQEDASVSPEGADPKNSVLVIPEGQNGRAVCDLKLPNGLSEKGLCLHL